MQHLMKTVFQPILINVRHPHSEVTGERVKLDLSGICSFHFIFKESYGEMRIYDAGVLASLPETHCDRTVFISPFAGPLADICPEDDPSKWTKNVKFCLFIFDKQLVKTNKRQIL